MNFVRLRFAAPHCAPGPTARRGGGKGTPRRGGEVGSAPAWAPGWMNFVRLRFAAPHCAPGPTARRGGGKGTPRRGGEVGSAPAWAPGWMNFVRLRFAAPHCAPGPTARRGGGKGTPRRGGEVGSAPAWAPGWMNFVRLRFAAPHCAPGPTARACWDELRSLALAARPGLRPGRGGGKGTPWRGGEVGSAPAWAPGWMNFVRLRFAAPHCAPAPKSRACWDELRSLALAARPRPGPTAWAWTRERNPAERRGGWQCTRLGAGLDELRSASLRCASLRARGPGLRPGVEARKEPRGEAGRLAVHPLGRRAG